MPQIEKKQKTVWSPDQVRKIIEATPPVYKTLVTLVALTGIRLGELLALQCKHVDFKSGLLLISQSLWHGQIVPPKTEGSVRSIPLGTVLCEVLKNHFQVCSNREPGAFVFCKCDGSPLHHDVIRKDVLYPIIDRLGIERHPRASGFHAFHHCAATFINGETGNLKLAQNFLGHSNLSTTADIYIHKITEADREASKVLEKTIFGNLFPVVLKIANENKSAVN